MIIKNISGNSGISDAGYNTLEINTNLSAGEYLLTLEANTNKITKKVIIIN